jgi:hypothetical protein
MKEEKILNYTLRNLNIDEICPNSIEGVILSIKNGKLEMDLPPLMSSDFFRKWFQGRGGIFSKDIKNYIKGNFSGNYILLEGNRERFIIRLIEENEIPNFEIKKLIEGKVKDRDYMILRKLKENESLTTSLRYIKEINEEIEQTPDIPHNEDEDHLIQSIQLFTD